MITDVTIINSLLEKVKQLDQSARLSLVTVQSKRAVWLDAQSTGLSTAARAHVPRVPLHAAPVQHTLSHTQIQTLSIPATITRVSHQQELLPQSKGQEWATLILPQVTVNSKEHLPQDTGDSAHICSGLTHCLTARDLETKKNKTPLT